MDVYLKYLCFWMVLITSITIVIFFGRALEMCKGKCGRAKKNKAIGFPEGLN